MVFDEQLLDDEITGALVRANVAYTYVHRMKANMKNIIKNIGNFPGLDAGFEMRKIILAGMCHELCRMLDPGKPAFTPEQGKTSVIMFVGFSDYSNITACTQYAYYHQRKGWKPSLVCADSFRGSAFVKLKQQAGKANIPFYGSDVESDRVKIAVEGVEKFKKENSDLIIVYTLGQNEQTAAFSEATKPDLVIFVMDSSMSPEGFYLAQAYKLSVDVGAVILTGMNGPVKGGAVSAVSATKRPVIFVGTGDQMDEFENFDAEAFIRRLLGMGDWSGFIHKVFQMDQQPELLQKFLEGKFTFRIMCKLFENILQMRPTRQVFAMLRGFNEGLMPRGQERESWAKIKRYIIMMDSMTIAELDSVGASLLTESRKMRIARGSGSQLRDVVLMIEDVMGMYHVYGRLAKILKMFQDVPRLDESLFFTYPEDPQQEPHFCLLSQILSVPFTAFEASPAPSPVPEAPSPSPAGVPLESARIFNVLSYGAVGDGCTDDSTVLKVAWDDAGHADSAVLLVPNHYTFMIRYHFP